MRRSEAGAGQVGLLWVVFLIVLVLGLAGFTYIAFKDKASIEAERDRALKKEQDTFKKFQEMGDKISAISKAVGFKLQAEDTLSSAQAIQERIDLLKSKFPDHIAKDVSSLDQVIDGLVAAYEDQARKRSELEASLQEEMAQRKAAEENINTIQVENQKKISELEAQLNDERQRAQSQQEEDGKRISNLQAQLDEAQNKVREAEQKLATEVEKAKMTITMLNARIAAQAKKLEVLREPDRPDGTIIGASPKVDLAYIDIGKKDGLRRGTKFQVFRYGKGGVLVPKGWIEVRDVDEDTAVCGVISMKDRFDPIVKGDVVVNPHFARNMVKTFVFLGQFPPSMSKAFVAERLKALGARVADKVDADTDFLVLGEKEPGEFAQKLEDMPEFKLATQLGVQIYRLKELAAYITY